MAWQTPTLAGLIDRARKAFRAELPGSDAWIWPNNVTVSAKVIAGAVYELFGRLDWCMRQLFASTAEATYLDRHGYEIGLSRLPAAPAGGSVSFTATGAFALSAGALLEASDGQQFALSAAVSLAGAGTIEADVVAVATGLTGNLVAGTALTIVDGTADVTAEVGSDGFADGADAESDESYRERILFRKRNPPHGGAPADYVMWCKAVPGVTRVFVERTWLGAGTVRVFPLLDDLRTNGIPTAADLTRIRTFLDTVAPASAGLTLAAADPVAVNVLIQDLDPDTTDVREAIKSELASMFRRRGRVSGSDAGNAAMPYLATPFTLSRSWVAQAVSEAAGEDSHLLRRPTSDLIFSAGQIPVLGTVTYE